jgi:hypothetical protein
MQPGKTKLERYSIPHDCCFGLKDPSQHALALLAPQ